MRPNWILMPVMGNRDLTVAAIASCLQQSLPVRLLLINQGVPTPFRQELESIAEQTAMDLAPPHPRPEIFVWHHQPPLPSLAATWNRALQFVWEAGGTEALVVNNDVVLHAHTYRCLRRVLEGTEAFFVSAVGVRAEQFPGPTDAPYDEHYWASAIHDGPMFDKGGPDFSCFLISRACHEHYPFDEGFTPAYCEDLDYHRRLLLGGDGHRIFSVNLPYLHHASGTLSDLSTEKKAALHRAIEAGSRAHYARKWGGPLNQETFREPFGKIHGDLGVVLDETPVTDGSATTPRLQAALREESTP